MIELVHEIVDEDTAGANAMRTTLFILSGDYHDQRQVHVNQEPEGQESVPPPAPAPPPEPLRDGKGQILSAVEPLRVKPCFRYFGSSIAALAKTLGGSLSIVPQRSGRIVFSFRGVPHNLAELLLNDQLQVSARDLLANLEAVYSVIAQNRRR